MLKHSFKEQNQIIIFGIQLIRKKTFQFFKKEENSVTMTRAKEDLELHTTVRITKKYPAPSESFQHTAERSHIISTPISLLRFQNNRLTCCTSRVRGFAHASRRWPETSNLLSVQRDTPRAEVSFRHGSVLRCAKLCANRETKTSLKK